MIQHLHHAVGAVIGMTIALRGFGAVIWCQQKKEFPFIGGEPLPKCVVFLKIQPAVGMFIRSSVSPNFSRIELDSPTSVIRSPQPPFGDNLECDAWIR